METLPDWAILVGDVGFPVLITLYLLTRFEKRIDRLTKEIQVLQTKLNQLDD